LPLYNADKIKGNATVFIHEGAKGARYCQGLIESNSVEAKAHPWRKELSGAVHVGWIGGALNPYRTDWSILRRNGIKKAYIICDNDTPGLRAVPIISEQLNMVTFVIQFTDEFPASFDLGDPFPPHMFGEAGYYIGPSFRECLHPATWATDLVPQEKGKPKAILRECFKGFWVYIEEIDSFICSEMPEIARSEAVLNKMCAPLSHVQDTARLIVKSYSGRITKVCYRPDCEGLNVTYRGSSAINLHVPTSIKAHAGDAGPFLDFMKYMFNDEEELKHVLKWCATLIARPSIRMGYGLLLISEQQGIGKTTLGAHILAPLVGLHNTSFPGENDITSAFNEWVAHKRLAVISEIYSGSSWRAYHALKSVITDREVTVNQKYMRQYRSAACPSTPTPVKVYPSNSLGMAIFPRSPRDPKMEETLTKRMERYSSILRACSFINFCCPRGSAKKSCVMEKASNLDRRSRTSPHSMCILATFAIASAFI
jgi:hypothetical protein